MADEDTSEETQDDLGVDDDDVTRVAPPEYDVDTIPPVAMGAEPLGIERWVQFAFIAFAVVLVWLFDKLFASLVEFVRRPLRPSCRTAVGDYGRSCCRWGAGSHFTITRRKTRTASHMKFVGELNT